jgi:mono/diheme cytochrome c family protein
MQLVSAKMVSGYCVALAMTATLLFLPSAARGQGSQPAQGQTQPAASASRAAPAPEGNADNGKKLWNTVGCYQCHGYSGQGGSAGPRLAPNPPSLSVITNYVRAPKGEMPPYTSKVLSDSQLGDIYAFLKSVPQPPDAKDIPLLNQK